MKQWLLWMTLAILGSSADAGDVRVQLVGHDAADCLSKGSLVAVPDEGRVRVEVPIVAGQVSYSVPLHDGAHWRLRLEAAGCWSESRDWSAVAAEDIVLNVHTAGIVEGAFEAPRGLTIPRLSALVYMLPAAGTDRGQAALAAGHDATCTISGLQWQCKVPANVSFDLRLQVPSFASVHYWRVVAQSDGGATQLEPQPLTPGASVSGWVHDPRDRPIQGARVSMFPLELLGDRPPPHAAARLQSVRTDKRGFFQIKGLTAGQYRLVTEARGYSPTITSEVPVRTGETITLPRPLRHAAFAEAEIVLNPPLDPQGKVWSVELTEAIPLYPGRPSLSVTRQANRDGLWKAERLRADLYSIEVRDSSDSVVQRASIDLFGGGAHALALTLDPVVIRGVVRAGDHPLQATLRLHQMQDASSKPVKVDTDREGRFEITVPARGRWHPTVFYPPGLSPAMIEAEPFVIPDDVRRDAAHEVTVQLPGGRIHGTVVDESGRGGRAAVHAMQGTRTAAQQMADEQGRFDFIGLAPGVYRLDAQNASGSTPEAVEVEIGDGESREVKLVAEPTNRISGVVVGPDGRPASGALLRISDDGGHLWSNWIADVNGHFEREVRRGLKSVQIIVLTYAYPAAVLSAVVGSEPLRIHLRNDGGILRYDFNMYDRRAYVFAGGIAIPYNMFYFPEPPGRFGGGIYVESGVYRLCPARVADDRCVSTTVNAGSDQRIDLNTRPTAVEGDA